MDPSPPDFVPQPAEGLRHPNVVAMFAARVQRSAHQPALRYKEGGAWRTMSWGQWQQASRTLAAGLGSLGVTRGQPVAILATTRREWVIADLAIAMAGAVSVPIYPSLSPAMVQAILADSGAVAIVVEGPEGLEVARRDPPSTLRHVVVIDPTSAPFPADDERPAHRWDALMEAGRAALEDDATAAELDALEEQLGPDDALTYVYTSGVTGEPKGVVLPHRAMVVQAWAVKNVVPVGHTDEQLLVLPLAHIFARHLLWATVEQGAISAFAESEERIYANLIEIAPTFMAAVPRMYERAYAQIREQLQGRGVTRAVVDRAFEVGRRVSRLRQRGEPTPTRLALAHAMAERMVFRRIREHFGGRIRFFVSGGAPLPVELAERFHAVGLLVLEGYGLSETCGATHVNRPHRFRFGTVGPALPGCEVRLAADGEVLVRGHQVMTRYHGRPTTRPRRSMPRDFCVPGTSARSTTASCGSPIARRICSRLHRQVRGALMIEQRLGMQEGIAHATVCGDARPHVVALVCLDEEVMVARSDREGLGCHGYADLAVHPRIRQIVQGHIDQVNAGLSRHERVRAFHIVPRPYAEATGELTPTRKVKRPVVLRRYAAAIEGLYADDSGMGGQRPAPGAGSFPLDG